MPRVWCPAPSAPLNLWCKKLKKAVKYLVLIPFLGSPLDLRFIIWRCLEKPQRQETWQKIISTQAISNFFEKRHSAPKRFDELINNVVRVVLQEQSHPNQATTTEEYSRSWQLQPKCDRQWGVSSMRQVADKQKKNACLCEISCKAYESANEDVQFYW